MPPHCDSLDGPVVLAARSALDQDDVDRILPYVSQDSEAELEQAFAQVTKARAEGPEARDVADLFFFETAVRLHRAGEGAAYTGLKPAGLDVGPVIPMAEDAITSGDAGALTEFLTRSVRDEIAARLAEVARLQAHRHDGLEQARTYVSAMLGFQVWAHKLYGAVHASPHEHPGD